MNLRPASWPVPFHSFRAGFTLSLGVLTISLLKRSTTFAIALTPPIRSYRLCSAIDPPSRGRHPDGLDCLRSVELVHEVYERTNGPVRLAMSGTATLRTGAEREVRL